MWIAYPIKQIIQLDDNKFDTIDLLRYLFRQYWQIMDPFPSYHPPSHPQRYSSFYGKLLSVCL